MKKKENAKKNHKHDEQVAPEPAQSAQPETAAPAAPVDKTHASPSQSAPPQKVKDDNPKTPSISTTTRRLVLQNPENTVDEISQMLIDGGWDAADVEKRKSTIATLRTDCLAIMKIAVECGWGKK
ncbi:MAG TPA: hypothetical protein VKW06_16140 [Candidatus Angelobacter sp.]|nr:hypothetical protein [Candidatus Angelobacter sp.]